MSSSSSSSTAMYTMLGGSTGGSLALDLPDGCWHSPLALAIHITVNPDPFSGERGTSRHIGIIGGKG
jgi:hypothetical protein